VLRSANKKGCCGFPVKKHSPQRPSVAEPQLSLKSRLIFRHTGGSRYPSPPPSRW
jgi:hypothetical protein